MSFRSAIGPFLACSALLIVSQGAWAQSKVAAVSMQRAVLNTAEIKKADAEMKARYQPKMDQAEALSKELESLNSRMQAGQGKMSDQALADLSAQATRKQRDLQRIQEDLQADTTNERNDVLAKALDRMTAVVKKLSEEKGFDLVVDTSQTVVYFRPALDITNDAIAAYDKAYPPGSSVAAPVSKK